VHDGDTITVSIRVKRVWLKDQDLTLHLHVENKWLTLHTAVRLNHIDAPELSTEQGKVARDILKERLLGKDIELHTLKNPQDKYGRWLGVVFEGGECINTWMITQKLARAYEGGKKEVF
jgi:endonuclease YncB( thermonuclease family)